MQACACHSLQVTVSGSLEFPSLLFTSLELGCVACQLISQTTRPLRCLQVSSQHRNSKIRDMSFYIWLYMCFRDPKLDFHSSIAIYLTVQMDFSLIQWHWLLLSHKVKHGLKCDQIYYLNLCSHFYTLEAEIKG